MKCMQCEKETNNPKFCSHSCSAKYSNRRRKHSETTKIKISETLSGKKFVDRRCKNCNDILTNGEKKYCSQKCHFSTVWKVKRDKIEISGFASDSHNLKRYIEETREYKCENCGISNWCGESMVLEMHHINGKGWDNRVENVLLLCPNCHSLAHKGDSSSSRKVSDMELLDALNSNKNISQALMSLNMTKSKASYDRCKRLIGDSPRG